MVLEYDWVTTVFARRAYAEEHIARDIPEPPHRSKVHGISGVRLYRINPDWSITLERKYP